MISDNHGSIIAQKACISHRFIYTEKPMATEFQQDTENSYRLMEALVKNCPALPEPGALIEGTVIGRGKMELYVKDANKGGLILEWQGVDGFIPASQLKSEHYPRIEDGDKEKIVDELRKLIGEKISVVMIGADPKENKLIFSEKDTDAKSREEMVSHYRVGDVVDGEITGAVDFGVFVKVEEGLEGLVHISEMDWALVEDPRKMFTIGEKVKVKVIDVKEGKISLSIKALKPNPWVDAAEKYKKGDTVKGVVIRFNKYGALVSIEEGVAGLVHISEFGSEEKLREKLSLGKSANFRINIFEPKDQKLTLSFIEFAAPV